MTEPTSDKLKAHEFAKKLGIESRELFAIAKELGEHITNPQSWVTLEQQDKVRAARRPRTPEKDRKPAPGKFAGKDVMAMLKRAHDAAAIKPKAAVILKPDAAPEPSAAELEPQSALVNTVASADSGAAASSPAPSSPPETAMTAPDAPLAPVDAAPSLSAAEVEAAVGFAALAAPAPRPRSVDPLPAPMLRLVKKAPPAPPPAAPTAQAAHSEPVNEAGVQEAAAPSPTQKPLAVEPMALPKLRIKKDEPRVIVLKKMDAPDFKISDKPQLSSAIVSLPAPGSYQPPRPTARPGQRRAPPPPPSGGRGRKERGFPARSDVR